MVEIEQVEFIEGFALTGEEVKNTKDKNFLIVETPEYYTFQDGDNAKRRLKMKIQFNNAIVDFYPNKTSQAKIIGAKGRRLSDWVGFKGTLTTENMVVGKEKREVIYVK